MTTSVFLFVPSQRFRTLFCLSCACADEARSEAKKIHVNIDKFFNSHSLKKVFIFVLGAARALGLMHQDIGPDNKCDYYICLNKCTKLRLTSSFSVSPLICTKCRPRMSLTTPEIAFELTKVER